jgi:hypothetical protein
MATHFPPRANAPLRPATTSAATSPTRAGGRADARAGAGENDDDGTPGPRRPPDPERAQLLELTHLDSRDEQPHFDIRGTAVGSSADDVIVHMRDDHIEVRINLDPRILEGFDSHLFTHLTNMLGIADIAHLSEVSRATHALTLRVPAAKLQQERWTNLQQQFATNHQQMIAPLQSQLSTLRRAACCLLWRHEVLPGCMMAAFVAIGTIAIVGVYQWASVSSAPNNDEYLLRRNLAMGFGIPGLVGIVCIVCYCLYPGTSALEEEQEIEDNREEQNEVIRNIRNVRKTLEDSNLASMRSMRVEPMSERFNQLMQSVPVQADTVQGSSSSSSSSSAASSSSEPARPPPLSREQQRWNMALIVSRHQIWQILTQGGYPHIPFNPDVAYPGDISKPTASIDPEINALFSNEDALELLARELSLRPDVPEPSSDPSPAGERQGLLEPESQQPSPSVASTTSRGLSSSSISNAGAGSGWNLRTDLEDRRKLIVGLLQRQGFLAEYEVGRAYPGDGTGVVPLDVGSLSYQEVFSNEPVIAAIRAHVTQAGARRQPAAVRVADDGLPIATSVEDAERLQGLGYEVKFHLPAGANDSREARKPRDPSDLD